MTDKDRVAERDLVMTLMVTPVMVNFVGDLHGGDLLKWLDGVAYACSCRYAGCHTVTLSVDQVFFREPIHIGELLTGYATVNRVGRTSMEIGIKVIAENLSTHKKRHTNTCYFTMVAMGENRRPVPVPPYTPQTEDEKRRFESAVARHKMRMSLESSAGK